MTSESDSKDHLRLAMKGLRRGLWAVVLFSFFINLFALTSPLYMIQIYDRVLSSRSEATLLGLTLLALFLYLVYGGLLFIRSRLLNRLANRLDQSLNNDLFAAIFRDALEHPGRATAQGLDDAALLRNTITGAGLVALVDIPWSVIFFVVLFLFHPWFGYVGTVAAALLLVFAVLNHSLSQRPMALAQVAGTQANELVVGSLRNREAVHSMGMLPALRMHWLRHHLKFLYQYTIGSDRGGLWGNLSKVVRSLSRVFALAVGAYLVLHLEISPGMIIAGSIIIGLALNPLTQLIGSWRQLLAGRSAYRRLEKLMGGVAETEKKLSLPPLEGRLSLEEVRAYPPGRSDGPPVLDGISFSVEAGQTLAVIGASGSGKSSLLRVILGLWPVSSGKVRLDGANIEDWDRLQLGYQTGYVPQDVELFGGSVAANIARFGQLDDEAVIAAAKLAAVHALILQLPAGYQTQLGIGGTTLSAGQRQRVALARALFGSPSLVVLDEPMTNLDRIGSNALLISLDRLRRLGVTIVVATYSQELLARSDRVLMLDQGRVRGFGTTEEILGNWISTKPESRSLLPGESGDPASQTSGSGGPSNPDIPMGEDAASGEGELLALQAGGSDGAEQSQQRQASENPGDNR